MLNLNICPSRSWVLFLGLAIFLARSATADVIVLDTETGEGQVGGIYGIIEPESAGDPPIVTSPDNDDGFQNYFLGRTTVSGFTTPERRAFFMFDTASIAGSVPAGHDITDVSIGLDVLFGGVLANFSGAPPVEFVSFTSTTASKEDILGASLDEFETMISIFDSFGTGTEYGGFEFRPGTDDDPTLAGEYDIPLPGAIPDLTDAIESGDIFIVTARLETFDPGPVGDDIYEFVFGLTDVVTSPGGTRTVADPLVPFLTITTVPEPSGMTLLLFAGSILLAGRRRSSSQTKITR